VIVMEMLGIPLLVAALTCVGDSHAEEELKVKTGTTQVGLPWLEQGDEEFAEKFLGILWRVVFVEM
jgi:hypothetical protein